MHFATINAVDISEDFIREKLNSRSFCLTLWDSSGQIIDCSLGALDFFGVATKEEFHKSYPEFTPLYQPDGSLSVEARLHALSFAFKNGELSFSWVSKLADGRHFDALVRMYRAEYMEQPIVCVFTDEKFPKSGEARPVSAQSEEMTRDELVHIALDAAPLACFLFDNEFNVIDLNQHVVDLFGVDSKAEINRRPFVESAPPLQPNGEDSALYSYRQIAIALEKGVHKCEWMGQTKSKRTFNTEATLVRIPYGNDFAVMVYLRETDAEFELAKQTNEKRLSQHRLQALLDSSPMVFTVFDKEHDILECNEKVAQIFGLNNKEEYQEKFYELLPEFQPSGVKTVELAHKMIDKAFETGYSHVDEWWQNTIDGRPLPFEVYLKRVRLNDKYVVIAHAMDLSETFKRKEAERGMHKRLQAMVDSLPLLCVIYTEDFEILDINQNAETLFGIADRYDYVKYQWQFSPEFQPCGSPSREMAQERLDLVFKTGEGMRFPWMHQTLDKEPLPCEITLEPSHFGEQRVVLAYKRDMREHFKLREMQDVAQRRLQTMVDSLPSLVCVAYNRELKAIEINQVAESFFGIADKRMYVESPQLFFPDYQPDGRNSMEGVVETLTRAFETGESFTFPWMHRTLSGEPIPSEVTLEPVDFGGERVVLAYKRDMREHFKLKEMQDAAQERFQALLDSSPITCLIIDDEFKVIEVNKRGHELFGLKDRQEFIDKFNDLHPEYQPDGRSSVEKALEMTRMAFELGSSHFEWMHSTLCGDLIPCEVSLELVTLHDRKVIMGYIRDLRELKNTIAMKKHLEHLAFTDSLTGVFNRRYFMEAAQLELVHAQKAKLPFTLLMIDVDYFKSVNDRFGHLVGDEVLKILTRRITQVLREGSLMARYGGEEFIVMLRETEVSDAQIVAERIVKTISDTNFSIGGLEIPVTVSIGVGAKTNQTHFLSDIIKTADTALYSAKSRGRNMVVV
ncbi:MAG: diguanylate cyclase [Clostridiales bacterium]|jgi:diguanylate cyclase (GGDEF)-like protein/PAS domain S-box-containing protein|nr:diguanylate cyclase [Clostridiales bacterium]